MSREKKFTPGLWESVTTDFQGDRHYGVSLHDDSSAGVALTGLVGDGDDIESEANANLIAAAPELLGALEEAKEWLVGELWNGKPGVITKKKKIDILEAAIKKAYGETP